MSTSRPNQQMTHSTAVVPKTRMDGIVPHNPLIDWTSMLQAAGRQHLQVDHAAQGHIAGTYQDFLGLGTAHHNQLGISNSIATGGRGPSQIGRVAQALGGVPVLPTINQATEANILLQVCTADKRLNALYTLLKHQWDGLKKTSMERLINDLDHLLQIQFKGQKEKLASKPTAEDVINSFNTSPPPTDWIGLPLRQFVELLVLVKQHVPVVQDVTDVLSKPQFKTSLVETLKKVKDLAEGKLVPDKIHDEVSDITKGLKLKKKRVYLPVISSVPLVIDNINAVKEELKSELPKIGGEQKNTGDTLLNIPTMPTAIPLMLQTPIRPSFLSEADATAINIYRNLIRNMEYELRSVLMENQDMKMLVYQLQIQQSLQNDPFRDIGTTNQDVGQGTGLEKLLRIFDQKVSMCKLKDVSQINFTTSIFAAGIFDTKGGHLAIKDAGVNLFIPPGAIPRGTRKEIYIYLDPDAHLKLENRKETRVAPIIHCGPPGTSFDEPFVLSFPHCAEDQDKWKFSGRIQGSSKSNWKHINDVDGISFVYGDHCTIMVNHFTNFTVTGTAETDGSKRMHMCTFSKDYNGARSHAFKVHAFNTYDTQAVITAQKKNKEVCRDDVKPFRVLNTGEDVKINFNSMKEGWKSEYVEQLALKHDYLWYENLKDCTSPCCLFRLETDNPLAHDSVYCRMKVKQDGNSEEMFLEMECPLSSTQMVAADPLGDDENLNVQMSRRLVGNQHPFYGKLPEQVCHKLIRHLDMKRDDAKDWRGFADKIGIESEIIIQMENRNVKDPTSTLLQILDRKYKTPGEFCSVIYNALRELGLPVASAWVEPFITE